MRHRGALSVVLACLLVGCGTASQIAVRSPERSPGGTLAPSPAPTPNPTPVPTWPLTGKPLDGDAALRPLAVRLDNAILAQPQAGLASADVVFDTIIEGCVNRLLAVYQSRAPQSIGSVRSARRYDLQLLPMLRGVFAHVGASDDVSQQLRDAAARGEFVDIDEFQFHPEKYPDYHRFYWRVATKPAPHNVYSSSESLRAAAKSAPGGAASVDVPSLGFLASSAHEATAGGFADSVSATRFTFPRSNSQPCPQGHTIHGYRDDYVPTYTWDARAVAYRRSAGERPTIDESTKAPVLAANVVVMWIRLDVTDQIASEGSWGVAYQVQPYTTGSGRLALFRDGRRVDGTWSRATKFDPFDLRNASGERILLSSGQTWIHFVPTYWELR